MRIDRVDRLDSRIHFLGNSTMPLCLRHCVQWWSQVSASLGHPSSALVSLFVSMLHRFSVYYAASPVSVLAPSHIREEKPTSAADNYQHRTSLSCGRSLHQNCSNPPHHPTPPLPTPTPAYLCIVDAYFTFFWTILVGGLLCRADHQAIPVGVNPCPRPNWNVCGGFLVWTEDRLAWWGERSVG